MKDIAIALLLTINLALPSFALADAATSTGGSATTNGGLTAMQENANELNTIVGFQDANIASIVSGILKVVLGLLAIIFLGLTVYSGIQWMTAAGNEEAVKKAKANLKNAVIGLFIIAMSYAITYFIFNQEWFFIGSQNGAGSSGLN